MLQGVYVLRLVTQRCPTLCNPMDCSPPGSSIHRDSPGKNTGVGCHALPQGISPTQGLNPGLPHCRQTLYQMSYKGSPRILEWVWDHFLNFSFCYFIVSVQKCNRFLCINFISYNFTEFVDKL